MVSFPYDKSYLINDLFFGWAFKPLYYYYKNTPTLSSTLVIPDSLSIESHSEMLKRHWETELQRPKPSFLRAITKTLGVQYAISAFIMLIAQSQGLIQAVLINYLIVYLSEPSAPVYQGALLTLAFMFSTILGCLCRANASLRVLFITGLLKTLIGRFVGEKVLKLNNSLVTDEKTRGKILNTLSTDMELLELTYFTAILWCGPFLILFGILIVTNIFGAVGIVGIAISVIHFPLIMILAKLGDRFRAKAYLLGDDRVKMIENLIEGIKIMKLYAWEIPFMKFISDKRKEEIKQRRIQANTNGILILLAQGGTGLAVFITLIVQVRLGYTFNSGQLFLLVGVFYLTHIQVVYANIPGITVTLAFIGVMKRVTSILLLKEFDTKIEVSDRDFSVFLANVNIAWREGKSQDLEQSHLPLRRLKSMYKDCLQSLNLSINPGELVLVVGPVGCGKSSLLIGLLGELNITSGSAKLSGTVAYASEEPWIIAGSIKENIIMDREFDPELYTETINACALITDLEILNNGDETLVGDRGFTLSGGQRARISLARAIYSQADIILLDDPLSAVDPEVANHIFNQCLKRQLKGKTVILATHQVQFLSQADKILVLDTGNMLFFGTFNKLQEEEDIKELLGEFAFHKGEKQAKKKQKDVTKEEANKKVLVEEKEITVGVVKLASYWRYLRLGMPSVYVSVLLLIILASGQVVYQGIFYWASVWSKQTSQDSSYYITGFGILILLTYFLFTLRIYGFVNIEISSNVKLHNKALKGIALTESVFFDTNPTGRIINRFSKDVGVIDGSLQYYLFETYSTTAFILGSMITCIIIIPYNAMVLPVWFIIVYLLIKYVSATIVTFRKLELSARGPFLTTITSCLNGLPTIRCLNLQKKFSKDLVNQALVHYRAYLSFHIFLRFSQLYSDIGSAFIASVNVMMVVGLKGNISPALAAYSLYASISILGLTSLWTRNLLELSSAMSSTQRLMEYSDISREGEFKKASAFQITKGEVKFENVFMRYRPNLPYILSGLSFTIKAGHKVGIIGRTGAGKSSILQVLFRLVNPDSGTVYIDNSDYKSLGLHDLRKQMSVIPQAATLFAAPLRDNLDPFHEHSDEEIFKALDEVNLKEIVLDYEEGLDVEVKNEGLNLSAGQKQLLCLARAILRKNKIIMMDEATANVDNETDRVIQKAIKEKFLGCTMLVIAHRIRTIIESEMIMVIDRGMCNEFGRPEMLYLNDDSLLDKW